MKLLFHFWLITLACFRIGFAQENVRFRQLTTAEGLPDNMVWNIAQDQAGFIWIGTSGGLCRYDGYEFKTYRHDPDDSTSISDNSVFSMVIDREGKIWCGNRRNGVSVLNPKTNKFKRYTYRKDDSLGIGSKDIRCLALDKIGNIWIGSANGVSVFDQRTKKFRHFFGAKNPDYPRNVFGLFIDSKNRKWIGGFDQDLYLFNDKKQTFEKISGLVWGGPSNFAEDKNGNILAGARGGFSVFDPRTGKTRNFLPHAENKDSLSGWLWRGEILCDSKETVWIGTEQDGICFFDKQKGKFSRIQHDPDDLSSLASNSIRTIIEDKHGLIWIGTANGISLFDPNTSVFSVFRHKTSNPASLAGNSIQQLYRDKKGNHWITTSDGISCLSTENNITNYHYDVLKKNGFLNGNFRGIAEDFNGNIYAFLFNGGKNYKLDQKKNLFLPFEPSSDVNYVYTDFNYTIYVGTNGNGVYEFNPINKTFKSHYSGPKDSNSLSYNGISCISGSRENLIWVGTDYEGLNFLNRKNGKCIHYKNNPKNNNSLSHNTIVCVHEARNRQVWVGTMVGLNCIDQQTGKIKRFYKKHGLADDLITCIAEDDSRNMWFGTGNGLTRFNPKDSTFTTYSISDGLPSNEINCIAYYPEEKKLYVGTDKGLVIFDPSTLIPNSRLPEVMLTSLTVLNKPYGIIESSFLKTLELGHEQYFFTLNFAGLEYTYPTNNAYAYKLEGLNNAWVNLQHKREITFTNLNPGEYTLLVKSSNNQGKWSETKKLLQIIIHPPWWQTMWFKAIVIAFVLLFLYTFYSWRTAALRKRQKLLEKTVQERTAEVVFQKQSIEDQKRLVEEKQKEIIDSIKYARRIQRALLPSSKYIKRKLDDLKKS